MSTHPILAQALKALRPVLIVIVLGLASQREAEPAPADDAASPSRPAQRWIPLHGTMTWGDLPTADKPPASDDGFAGLKINPTVEYDGLPRSVPSEESRYIENPYLLVGLREQWAFTKKSGEPKGLYVRPTRLSWHSRSLVAWVRYNLFSYLTEMSRDHQPDYTYYWDLWIIAYNARDLGLSFLSIDVKRSKGIRFSDLEFPARAYVKLWRERPRSADESPNVWFVIDMPREANDDKDFKR